MVLQLGLLAYKVDYTCPLVMQVQLRHKLAKLLGYSNYAEYALDCRMARKPLKVCAWSCHLKSVMLVYMFFLAELFFAVSFVKYQAEGRDVGNFLVQN